MSLFRGHYPDFVVSSEERHYLTKVGYKFDTTRLNLSKHLLKVKLIIYTPILQKNVLQINSRSLGFKPTNKPLIPALI